MLGAESRFPAKTIALNHQAISPGSIIWFFTFVGVYVDAFVCVGVFMYKYHSACVEVTEQSKSGHQAWQKALLPAGPSCQL